MFKTLKTPKNLCNLFNEFNNFFSQQKKDTKNIIKCKYLRLKKFKVLII